MEKAHTYHTQAQNICVESILIKHFFVCSVCSCMTSIRLTMPDLPLQVMHKRKRDLVWGTHSITSITCKFPFLGSLLKKKLKGLPGRSLQRHYRSCQNPWTVWQTLTAASWVPHRMTSPALRPWASQLLQPTATGRCQSSPKCQWKMLLKIIWKPLKSIKLLDFVIDGIHTMHRPFCRFDVHAMQSYKAKPSYMAIHGPVFMLWSQKLVKTSSRLHLLLYTA